LPDAVARASTVMAAAIRLRPCLRRKDFDPFAGMRAVA
jgi:hypothetical protein